MNLRFLTITIESILIHDILQQHQLCRRQDLTHLLEHFLFQSVAVAGGGLVVAVAVGQVGGNLVCLVDVFQILNHVFGGRFLLFRCDRSTGFVVVTCG